MKFEDGFSRKRARRAVGAIAALVGSSLALVPAAQAADGSTRIASTGTGGGSINAEARDPSISADGRYVAYESAASNVVGGDTNNLADIFVTDRMTGETVLVSQSSDGQRGNGASTQPSMSPDGRYVAFVTEATNFAVETNPIGADGQVKNTRDIYLRDLQLGTTTLVSPGGGNKGKVADSFDPSVSANGAYVAYTSLHKAVVVDDCNDVHDVFVWEKATGATRMVPVGSEQSTCGAAPSTFAGAFQGNRQSQNPSISADGRWIAFTSDASNLDTKPDQTYYEVGNQPPPTSGARMGTNVFLWDRTSGKSVRVDNASGNQEPDGDAGFVPAISGNGRYVAYTSLATNLVSGDTNTIRDTFVYDHSTGKSVRVSINDAGEQQACRAGGADQTKCQTYESPSISADGRVVSFISGADNLDPRDTNGARDVFVRTMDEGKIVRVNLTDGGLQANGSSTDSPPSVSGEGRFVAYTSKATNLSAGDGNDVADVFVADRSAPAQPGWSGAPYWKTVCTVDCTPPPTCTTCNPVGPPAGPTDATGYWLVATDGGIFSYGAARFHGSTGAIKLNMPIVGMSVTPGRNGYWLVASDGGIFAFGDAEFFGSTGAMKLNKPIVGMTATPSGKGYWLVASDGGIFAFGDARFQGSTGAMRLNKPIVGMTATPSGVGYWLVASDGGIFAFGDAGFHGSTGAIALAKPITAMTTSKTGNGYWMTATDGGIFNFGDAAFHGSTGAITLAKPIVAMTTSRTGNGYLMAGADGAIYAFGDAKGLGSLAGQPLAKPIVGMTGF